MNIAIVLPFSGGDIILSQKIVKALKNEGHFVTFYTDEQFRNILDYNPDIGILITKSYSKLPVRQSKDRVEILKHISSDMYNTAIKEAYDKVYICHSLDRDEFWNKINNKKYSLFDFAKEPVDIPIDTNIDNKIYIIDKDTEKATKLINSLPKRKTICIDWIAKSYPYDLEKIPSMVNDIAHYQSDFNFIINACQINQLPEDSIFKQFPYINKNNTYFIIDDYSWREWSEVVRLADYYIGVDSGISFLAGLHQKKSIIVRSKILPLTYSGWHYLFGHDNAVEINVEDATLKEQFNKRIKEWTNE